MSMVGEGRRARSADRRLDVAALVFSALALLASAASAAVAFRGEEREQLQQRQAYAQQVVVAVTDEVAPGFGGEKPQIDGSTIFVANFGNFPVEDVVVERPIDSESDLDVALYGVPAVRMGTIGPCQAASLTSPGGDGYERATFVDVNGVTWLRRPASPPTEELPDRDVKRTFPDIRDADRVERTTLSGCR